ncbi:50S ribosomal protein L22 [Candidatus Woesearchaeota archaeon]|nr:50S ribosomal protein L22 [Candidatus Woesearchaeota archaeon]
MKFGLSFTPTENMATAVGRDLPISTKQAVEICRFIRGKRADAAKAALERVLKHESPLPYTRHVKKMPHRPGMRTGAYPEKAIREVLKLLKSAEMNAHVKGLSEELVIAHTNAHLASRPMRYGRQSRRITKRTHIEVVLAEAEPKKDVKAAPDREGPEAPAKKEADDAKKAGAVKEKKPQAEAKTPAAPEAPSPSPEKKPKPEAAP